MEVKGKEKAEEVIVDRQRYDRNTNLASSSVSKVNKTGLSVSDAQLFSEFEQSGQSFNYNASVSNITNSKTISKDEMDYYLSKIQRSGLIQPFGCMIIVEVSTFKVIAYSENCWELLGLENGIGSRDLIGVEAETLFNADFAGKLIKAARYSNVSVLNPCWFTIRDRCFYAILQLVDVGILIDLEPARNSAKVMAEILLSQRLGVRAISRLQSVPEGNIGVLCDTLGQEMHKLSRYHRVMIYKFHEEDDHGEVISEIRSSDLEAYLGLHYPATDIPQAARFMFKQTRVRMICDCTAQPVKVIQSATLEQPVSLVGSALRAAHDCHNQYMENMGSIASLVLAIVVNQETSSKLWGLAVCHNISRRYVPFPVRQALQFLTQAFSVQLQMELQLATQKAEKRVLQMQTVLCDMLLRNAPFGIISQSPNMMDLVRCDGAAMVYGGECRFLGVTPTESQLMDIVQWLMNTHQDSTGLTTDSLFEAGYPGAALLGDAVCGMATARITSSDFLFWFRSNAAKEIKWGGAMHHTEDRDDSGIMHPRSSFRVFLQEIKFKSLPWDTAEINAIHSLQLIMRESDPNTLMRPQQLDSAAHGVAELRSVANDMFRLIETATAPIFGVDKCGSINGWNAKMVELTGLQASEAFGKSLLDEIIHKDSRASFQSHLCKALQGEEVQNIEIKLQNFQTQPSNAAVYLVVNACTSKDYKNDVVGACFVGQDLTSEKVVLDNYIRLQGDYKAIVHSPNPLIPPIFACDENACCTEWNTAMEKLTGFMRHEVIGKILPKEIFGQLCQLKDQDSLTKLMIMLHQAVGTVHDVQNMPFGFFDRKGKFVEVFLTSNKRVNEDGGMVGCLCFLQSAAAVKQQSSLSQQEETESGIVRNKEMAYICQEMKNPLHGIQHINKILQEMAVSDDQKKLIETSSACEGQLMSLLEDMSLGGAVEGSKRGLQCEEFSLGKVFDAIVSQVMILLKEKKLRLSADIPEKTKALVLFGDGVKLQMVLSDLLVTLAHHTPCDGWVEIKFTPGVKLIQGRHQYIHLQISLTHSGEGIPSGLIEDMYGERNECKNEQGMTLNICYNRVFTLMNGRISYIRELDKCYFRVDLEFQTPNKLRGLNIRGQ